jgi:hypothetical protein
MAMAAARRFVDRGAQWIGWVALDWEEWMSVLLEEPIEGHVECGGEVGQSGAAWCEVNGSSTCKLSVWNTVFCYLVIIVFRRTPTP